ncbi:MAG: hypothetical protein OXM01_15025, partial [Gemmatimonadota bacterium]|nr:hypothetical protein [Gemmatimonadota bacterium]
MKSALFSLLTCALTLGACSDRDPVSSNEPTEPAAKRRISSITWTSTPVAGRAESRIHPLGTDEAVQIRSLLSITGAASLGGALRNGVELAVRDFGAIHGRTADFTEFPNQMTGESGDVRVVKHHSVRYDVLLGKRPVQTVPQLYRH